MDNFIFLKPLTPSSSQPPRLPGGTSSNISRPSLASLSDRQTTSQFNQRNDFLKSQPTKSRDVSDLSQKSHSSDQRCRNDTVQDQDLTAQTSPNSDDDDDDDLPSIEKLLSGKLQKNSSASADPNGVDDDGFVDIDDVLSGIQQKSMLASANLNSGGIAVLVDNGTRGGSPTDSSCSNAGSSRDPIILSDDEPASAESETDCSDFDVDVRAKSASDPPHVARSELVDGGGIGSGSGSGAVLSPGRFVTDHSDDQNDHDGVFDNPQPRLSAVCPTLASRNSGSATHQASKTQVNADLIQGSTSYGDFDDIDIAEELESESFDVLAEGDEADSRSSKGRMLLAASDKNSSSRNNITGLQDVPPDDTQSPLQALAAASPHQPDLKNGHLPKQLRRGANRHDRRKRPRTIAPTRAVTTVSTASAASECADLEEPTSRVQITAPDELSDTDQRMVDGRSADDSDDEDYADMSDATGPTKGGRPHPRKRARRMKDQAHNDAGGPASHPLDVSRQAAPVASSSGTQESEEMSIHGYFTLKTVASKVVYCLTFSQDLLPLPQHRRQRQDSNLDCEHSQSSPLDCGTRQAPLPRQTMRRSWTRETTSDTISTRRPGKELTERQEILLARMVHDDKTWAEIGGQFPGHTLQSLKENFFTKQGGKPRKRGRKPGESMSFDDFDNTDVTEELEGGGKGGAVAMQQQKELGDPDVGDQDLVEVVDADDLEDKEVTEILLAAEP
ncbi:hypothetical protein BKA61DRAFT_741680 [Leptodontidium sp. MPI-SDFR-AT-0119]|nr:hypothetical protein BKA61DRAFT_741680 [Leptodontidium sp. MPI-SDFR-AT-0119]